jgi:hypothetical protein
MWVQLRDGVTEAQFRERLESRRAPGFNAMQMQTAQPQGTHRKKKKRGKH